MRLTNLFASSLLLFAACHDDKPPAAPDGPDMPDPHDVVIHTTNFYTGAKSNIELLAIQDGDSGAFTVLTGTDGTYRAHVTNDRYTVMTACHDGPDFNDTSLWYRHVSDGAFDTWSCDAAATPLHLTLAVKNIPVNADVRIRYYAAGTIGLTTAFADGPLEPLAVPTGAFEGVAIIRDAADHHTIGLVRIPTTDLKVDQTLTIDAGTRVAPSSFNLTALSTSNAIDVQTSLVTKNYVYGMFPVESETMPYHYLTPPQSFLGADDLIRVLVTAPDGTSGALTTKVSAQPVVQGALTGLEVASSQVLETPYLRPSVTFKPTAKTLANQTYDLWAFTGSRALFVDWTSAWVGTSTSVAFTMPDFTGLAGYSNAYTLEANQPIDWNVSRYEDNGIVGNGRNTQGAQQSGTLGKYCGDGIVQAGEACDDAGDSATCNYDCTAVKCGDGYPNYTAGEECDPPDGSTCDATCKSIAPPPSAHAMTRTPSSKVDRVLERRQRAEAAMLPRVHR